MPKLPSLYKKPYESATAENIQRALSYIDTYWDTLRRRVTEDSGTLVGLP